MHFDLAPRVIYEVRTGSHAYGTATATSDEDYAGIAIAPVNVVAGFFYNFEQHLEQVAKGAKHDRTIYDLRKLMRLASDCNPNVIELLFTDSSNIIRMTPYAERLLAAREEFISLEAQERFAAYAMGQLRRIKTHRSWLLNPPKAAPERKDFGLSDQRVLKADELGAITKLTETEGYELAQNVWQLVDAEKRFATAKKHWEQYNDWKKSRNVVRAELEAFHGYDTKHGMHLVRLMRMCTEILTGKGVIVKRPDAEELLAIRNGEWSYDKLVEYAERLDAETKALATTSSLRKQADRAKLNQLCEDLHLSFWHYSMEVPQL